jgi:quercetin dioxygenase-like cupin family protein
MRTNRSLIATAAAALIAMTAAGIVVATPAENVTSTTLGGGGLAGVNILVKTDPWMAQLRTKGDSTIQVVENRVAAGGTFGWHSHPGPSVIVVKQGTITFYRGNDPTCTGAAYSAGQALVDPGNVVHVGRNEGSTEVIVLVTRFLPSGASPRIDQPANPACGF